MVVSAGTCQPCFRLWLKSNMLQASTYINDDEDRWRICASLGDNAFLPFFAVETGIFRENYVNIITVDALAPCVAKPPATMVLTQ